MRKFFIPVKFFAQFLAGLFENLLVAVVSVAVMIWVFLEHPIIFRDLLDGNLAVFRWICGFIQNPDRAAQLEVSSRGFGFEGGLFLLEITAITKVIAFLIRRTCSRCWKKATARFRRSPSESDSEEE